MYWENTEGTINIENFSLNHSLCSIKKNFILDYLPVLVNTPQGNIEGLLSSFKFSTVSPFTRHPCDIQTAKYLMQLLDLLDNLHYAVFLIAKVGESPNKNIRQKVGKCMAEWAQKILQKYVMF